MLHRHQEYAPRKDFLDDNDDIVIDASFSICDDGSISCDDDLKNMEPPNPCDIALDNIPIISSKMKRSILLHVENYNTVVLASTLRHLVVCLPKADALFESFQTKVLLDGSFMQ